MSNSMSRPCGQRLLDRVARRAIEIAVHLGPFQELAVLAHALELAHRHEVIVLAVDLARGAAVW